MSPSDAPALVRALNDGVADQARRYDALIADVHAHFLGHGTSAGGDRR